MWCVGFSLQWLLLLRSTGSRCAGFSSCGSRALERRLSSCGARASLLHGMWDLPGPGIEPVSPALAGRFLSTAPPGKPRKTDFRTCPHIEKTQDGWLFQSLECARMSNSSGSRTFHFYITHLSFSLLFSQVMPKY